MPPEGLGMRDWGLGLRRVSRVTLLVFALVAPIAPIAPIAPVFAQPLPPELTRPINDFASVIDEASETEIERRILEHKGRGTAPSRAA